MCISALRNKAIRAALIICLVGLGHTTSAAVVLQNEISEVSASATVETPTGSESTTRSRHSLGRFSADFDELVEVDIRI